MKVFFFLLFLTHFASSLPSLPTFWRQWIWLGGLLLAFFWMNRTSLKEKAGGEEEIPLWVWAALPVLGLFFRLFRFISAPVWPMGDEFVTAQAGLQLSHQWNWNFFRSDGESPPLLDWIVGLWFKISDQLFWGLWSPSFLISCLTLAVVYWTARRFFSKGQTFFLLFIWATGFWPVYCQGLALQETLFPLWEWGVFYLWLSFGKIPAGPRKLVAALALGFWAGLGYWTYVPWPVVAVSLFMGILFTKGEGKWDKKNLAGLAGAFIAALIPFFAAAAGHGYGTHIRILAAGDGEVSLSRMLSAVDYVNILFWGHWTGGGPYVPTQSGLLNPLEASFFWIGLWGLITTRSTAFSRWVFFSLVLFLAPGILSRDLQTLRIIPLLPLVLGISALGAAQLFRTFTPGKDRKGFLVVLLLATLLMNAGQLGWAFQRVEAATFGARSTADYLRKISLERGPGLLFTEFNNSKEDAQSLQTAVYPFNAAQNLRLDPLQAGWLAFWINPSFQGYLHKKYPEMMWWEPLEDPHKGMGILGWMPVRPGEAALFLSFIQADHWFQKITWESNDVSTVKSYEEVLAHWRQPDPSIQADPFLRACYRVRLADFIGSFEGSSHFDDRQEALKRAREDFEKLK